jgi:DNA-nicking Smr family endonuclease
MCADMKKQSLLVRPEDLTLWQRITKDVKPLALNQKNIISADIEHRKIKIKKMDILTVHPEIHSHIIKPVANKIDERRKRHLIRGKADIDARLDLHGLTQDQAHIRLKSFILNCYNNHKRFVIVITGKGKSSDGFGGVIKKSTPHWLQFSDISPYIIGFEQAHINHGGAGALYVWIRKKRDKAL